MKKNLQDMVEELNVLRTEHKELSAQFNALKFMYVELRLACRTGSQEEIQATLEKHTTQGDSYVDETRIFVRGPADGCPG